VGLSDPLWIHLCLSLYRLFIWRAAHPPQLFKVFHNRPVKLWVIS
jgi:hypothetical protein